MNGYARPVASALDRLNQAAARLRQPVAFMEVCGTHTVAAFRSGLHSLMPSNVRLVSGPGCPVCVTSQGDIDLLLEVAERPGVVLCTYGDMLRVPGSRGSLEEIRSRGADVRTVYSAMEAVDLAQSQPHRQVVFAAVGFETTAPATAVAVLEAQRRGLKNFSILCSHKRILPAMLALLESGQVQLQGFLCPGHVSVIVGSETFRPIVEKYGLSCVIAGFEPVQIAVALARLTELVVEARAALENLYPVAVRPEGNRRAQELLEKVFEPVDMHWRGLDRIPASGLALRPELRMYDATERFALKKQEAPEPPGCRCGQVITARCTPADCRLFATVCTPAHPVGPCMVSSEGTCQAWFKYRRPQPLVASAR